VAILRKAIVDASGDVENVIVYDDSLPPEKQWKLPTGRTMIDVTDTRDSNNAKAEPGGRYVTGTFSRKA